MWPYQNTENYSWKSLDNSSYIKFTYDSTGAEDCYVTYTTNVKKKTPPEKFSWRSIDEDIL